jgi:hypothetical protein
MTLPPGYRGRIPAEHLTLKREPWPVRRLRGLRLYLGWWLADVVDDLRGMWGRR